MEVSEDRYRELGELINSDESPVGIDAKKAHIIILNLLDDIRERLVRIEEKLQ